MKAFITRISLRLFFVLAFIFSMQPVFAQKKNDIVVKPTLDVDTTVSSISKKTEQVAHVLVNAKNILNKGVDTSDISEELPDIEKTLNNLNENFKNNQRILNLRNLKLIKSVLVAQQDKTTQWEESTAKYTNELNGLDAELNTIIKDSVFLYVPKDTLLKIAYKKQILAFNQRWKKADTLIKNSLNKFNNLQSRVSGINALTGELLDEANLRIINFTKHLWKPEEKALWKISADDYSGSFLNAIVASYTATSKVFLFYVKTNANSLAYYVVLFIAIVFWLKYVIRTAFKQSKNISEFKQGTSLIVSSTIGCAFLMMAVFVLLFAEEMPISFTLLFWILIAVVYTTIYKNHETFKLKFTWISISLLVFAFLFLNMLTRSSLVERWLHLILVSVSLFFGYKLYKYVFSEESHFPAFGKYIIILYMLLIAASFLFNISGSFTLSKYLSSSAVTALFTARILFSIVDIFIETIYLHYEAFEQNSRLVSLIDFSKTKEKVQRFLYFIMIVVWLMILARNLSIYDYIYDSIDQLFSKKRTIGSFNFSYGSVVIFVIVIWISTFLSKLLLILFGGLTDTANGKKNKFASSVLLLRLGVLSAGILLAFAASGIPMDKLTIIIGALGVGIGFGLQNVVNNLVSGVILAFEKPIQVGDAVEVSNRFGTVKEIGIRSTKLTTVEGSDVIVPNGDLLSHHIINWTLSSQYRRVELIIGVGYNSNLQQVENILKKILQTIKGIEQTPEPHVLAHNFSASSVDFRLLFWSDMDNWIFVKSDVLFAVFTEFAKNNIEIPFPQTDVHIKSEK